MVKYREPSIKDVNAIIKLEIDCMDEIEEKIGYEFPIFDDIRNSEKDLITIIEGKCGIAYIAEEIEFNDSKILGAVIAIDKDMIDNKPINHKRLDIRNVFIHSEYRRHGIADKLLEQLDKWAIDNKYEQIRIMLYLPNPEAEKALAKYGMKPVCQAMMKIIDNEKYIENKKNEIELYYRYRERNYSKNIRID